MAVTYPETDRHRCPAILPNGKQCTWDAYGGWEYCPFHQVIPSRAAATRTTEQETDR